MGAAAEHRGNELIRRQCREAIDAQHDAENAALALQVSEDCNAFTTQAMGYLIEPKGLRQNTVERAKLRRGWGKRHAPCAPPITHGSTPIHETPTPTMPPVCAAQKPPIIF
jgi:hypothetical protein